MEDNTKVAGMPEVEIRGLLNLPTHLTLGQVIKRLEAEPDWTRVVPLGFANAHSYRGSYEQLAFEPAPLATVGSMLAAARYALGLTFQGWKGGDYFMHEDTLCWLAVAGYEGETLGALLLNLMLAAPTGEQSDG